MNLDDFDFSERWVRVRGKGRKERQVPYAGKAAEALDRYLAVRNPAVAGERALFLNHRGGRLTDRGARGIVKFYARMITGDSSIHPHSLRHAYATHLLSGRRRPARHPGTAGTRAALHHAEVHAGFAGGLDGGIRQSPSQGVM